MRIVVTTTRKPKYCTASFRVTVAGAIFEPQLERIAKALLDTEHGEIGLDISAVEFEGAEGVPIGIPGWDTDDDNNNEKEQKNCKAIQSPKHQRIFSRGPVERTLCGQEVSPNEATTNDDEVTCVKCIDRRIG